MTDLCSNKTMALEVGIPHGSVRGAAVSVK
jgi:hypothetical protein